jgi:citrate synthase
MSVISRGLEGIVATDTRLGDVRGQEGQLIYCGYDINELAGKASFEEVIYLLWHNKLPTRSELTEFKKLLAAERQLPDQVVEFLKTAPKTALPIDVLRTAVSMLGLHDLMLTLDESLEATRRRAISITAKVGVIIAYFHRARNGLDLPPVRPFSLFVGCPRAIRKEDGDAGRRLRVACRTWHECFHL